MMRVDFTQAGPYLTQQQPQAVGANYVLVRV